MTVEQTTLEIFLVFLRISIMSVGGIFGVLPELERLIVHEHQWLTTEQFYQAYVIGQFAPGPTVAFCPIMGYMIHGWSGFGAGFLGVYLAPTALIFAGRSLYSRTKSHVLVKRLELSLRPLIIGLLLASTLRLGFIQSRVPHHQEYVWLWTLTLMCAALILYSRTRWDLLIHVLIFGGLWGASIVIFVIPP